MGPWLNIGFIDPQTEESLAYRHTMSTTFVSLLRVIRVVRIVPLFNVYVSLRQMCNSKSVVHMKSVVQKHESRAGASHYIPQCLWDVITCPCPWCLLLAQQSYVLCGVWFAIIFHCMYWMTIGRPWFHWYQWIQRHCFSLQCTYRWMHLFHMNERF